MSDRIAVMNRGRYEQLGDPETLYERPTTRFVAGFLGVSNLLRGTPDGTADGYAVVKMADGAAVRVPTALVDGRTPGRRRRSPGEDPDPRGRSGHAGRVQLALGHRDRRVVHRRQHAVQRRDPGRRPGSSSTSRTSNVHRSPSCGAGATRSSSPGPRTTRSSWTQPASRSRTRWTDRATGGGLPGGSRHTHLDTDHPPQRPRGRRARGHGGVPRRLRHQGHGDDRARVRRPDRGSAVGLRGRRSQRGRIGPGLRRRAGRDALGRAQLGELVLLHRRRRRTTRRSTRRSTASRPSTARPCTTRRSSRATRTSSPRSSRRSRAARTPAGTSSR